MFDFRVSCISLIVAASSCWARHKARFKRRTDFIGTRRSKLMSATEPELPNVPHVLDVFPNPYHKKIFNLVLSQLALARPFIARPGVPAERVKELRVAFNATAKDPEFLADLAQVKQTVRPYTGEQIKALLKQVYATPPELIAQVREAMTAK